MATALIVLAIGSVVAGYVGVPAVLGGSNAIEHYLEPCFEARGATHDLLCLSPAATAEGVPHGAEGAAPHASEASAHESTELSLMAVSIALAFLGIGLAWFFFIKSPGSADGVASAAGPLHTLLLNKYYIDELYDAVFVKPILALSRGVLWKVVDAEVIDGAVNGAGAVVETGATWLRRLQTGSVRVYAASILLGVVLVLGYYVWRFGQMATF
jgi:NADH-quinone oxidoreductase subunit L